MRKNMNCWLLIILSAFCTVNALPKIDSLLQAMDYSYSMDIDVKARVRITQQKSGQGTKKMEMLYYRRDASNSFLIVMTDPPAEKGNGYLRVGDNFWMYRKNTGTFQKINRDESIGGTDLKGDDLEERKLMEMYVPAKDSAGKELISEDTLGEVKVYRFEIKAKVNDVDYPRKVYWIRRDNGLILKEESYSLSGTLMQTTYFLKYRKMRKAMVPVKQLFVDEFEKGNKTVLEISDISTEKLDDSVFTKAYLENLNKR